MVIVLESHIEFTENETDLTYADLLDYTQFGLPAEFFLPKNAYIFEKDY